MQWRFNFCYVILKAVMLFSFCVNSYATTYYVAINGDDGNPGTTEDKPFRTIQKAADIIKAGDIVLVKQGTYGGFRIEKKHGRDDAWIIFKPAPGHEGKVVIKPSSGNGIDILDASYLEINGLEITHGLSYSENYDEYSQWHSWNGIKLNSPTSVYEAPHHIKIVNNHIHHVGESGFHSTYGHDHVYLNNHIHHVGISKRGHGMYIGGEGKQVRGNVVHHAYGQGIVLFSGAGIVKGFIVENNISFENGSLDYGKGYPDRADGATGKRRGDGIFVAGPWDLSGGVVVRNNYTWRNTDWGIRVDSRDALVVNNTMYENQGHGLFVYPNQNVTIRNNLIYKNNNGEAETSIADGNKMEEQNNLIGIDPHFASGAFIPRSGVPPIPDFHLTSNSQAIDRGSSQDAPPIDIDGTPRPQGAGWDIGAHEFGGAPFLTANLNANPTSGQAPLLVNFSGSASGGKAPYNYSWNFGDGNTSVQQNPTHTYQQANSYTTILIVTDSENKQATASRAIVVDATSSTTEPIVTNMRFSEVDQTADLLVMATDKWYDLYLYVDDPQGWNDISFADVWLSHESNNEGTIANRGGRYFAASNYVMSYSIEVGRIWAKQTEGTEAWSNITGQVGLYVDDDNNEYEQNSIQKWAKARIKLLQNAQTGNWVMNAYVIDKAGHRSSLFQRNFRVSATDNFLPTATITLSDPSPTKTGSVQVSLTTSKRVVKIPTPLIFIESDSSTTQIDLSGSVPGSIFNGIFVVDDTVADGFGHFSLPAEALVDENGIKGNEIKSGASIKIDKSPPSTPKNVKVDIIPP